MSLPQETRVEAMARLLPRVTDDFLETLVLAARVIGWSVDLSEVQDFIRELCAEAGKTQPTHEQMGPIEV